ncbi:DUF559 domain-containing protein [Frigoribacterium sp. 2-23]|uniref:DUF559 domain-containing protein n=1 Tax=Frigoribacterium sp. 2-23 TaxID=3415006 RepID=UPI003C6EFFD3
MDERLSTAMRMFGGVAARHEILRFGVHPKSLEAAWAAGAVIRVRHGTYALPSLSPDILRAARVGGVLASASAAVHHGGWAPHAHPLFVSVRHNSQRLREPEDSGSRLPDRHPDVVILRDLDRLDPRRERAVVSPETAIVQLVRSHDAPVAIAVIDSMLNRRLLTPQQLKAVRSRLPKRLHSVLTETDARAEAGTESIARVGFARAGLSCSAQVWVTDSYRVDLLIDGWLIVECASVEHHGSPEQYNRDRRRIADLHRLGFIVLEFSYPQIMFDFDAVLETVMTTLANHAPAR